MIPVKDSNGNKVNGVFRDSTGALIVSNDQLLKKHQTLVQSKTKEAERIRQLEESLEQLQEFIRQHLATKKTE